MPEKGLTYLQSSQETSASVTLMGKSVVINLSAGSHSDLQRKGLERVATQMFLLSIESSPKDKNRSPTTLLSTQNFCPLLPF